VGVAIHRQPHVLGLVQASFAGMHGIGSHLDSERPLSFWHPYILIGSPDRCSAQPCNGTNQDRYSCDVVSPRGPNAGAACDRLYTRPDARSNIAVAFKSKATAARLLVFVSRYSVSIKRRA
jgi:hypothetical protein